MSLLKTTFPAKRERETSKPRKQPERTTTENTLTKQSPESPTWLIDLAERPVRAPNIRIPSFGIPHITTAGRKAGGHVYRNKLKVFKHLLDFSHNLELSIYHAKLEEDFLGRLEKLANQTWGWHKEAGVREMQSMRSDLLEAKNKLETTEYELVDNQLKAWIKANPGRKFYQTGTRIPGVAREIRRHEIKRSAKVREQKLAVKQKEFWKSWRSGIGKGSTVRVYQAKNQQRTKIKAKKHRRRKVGGHLVL